MKHSPLKPFGVTGETLEVKGQQNVSFVVLESRFDHVFLVYPLPTYAAGLLGMDFFERTGANVNFECGKMALAAIDKAPRAYEVISAKVAVLTVFSEGEARRNPLPIRQEELHTDGHPSDNPRSEMTASGSKSWSGKKIPHEDALSRYVGTVLRDGSLSPENFLLEQGKDKYCQSLKIGSHSEGHESFRDDTGLIYSADPKTNIICSYHIA